MCLLLFASAYSSTPRPPSLRHIHPTFQHVRIAWICDPCAFPGWYYVMPVHPECAPVLYRPGWYVHHTDLHIVALPNRCIPLECLLKEVSHA
jgi:hypothetical protein